MWRRFATRPPRRPKGALTQLRSLLGRTPYEPHRTYSREMQERIDRLFAREAFDVVQLESTLVWPFRFPAGTPLVLDEHNVDYETYARMREGARSPIRKAFYLVEEGRVRRYEQDAWRRSSGLVLTSAREEEMAREVAPDTATAVVPNGVDTDYFTPGSGEIEPQTIVFNGVLDYRPNLDAALFLADEVLPRVHETHPDARVVVVGRGGPDELNQVRRPNVEATGEVPDVRPYLARAEVVAVPILAGKRHPLQGRRRPGDGQADGLHRGRLRGHRGGARATPAHRGLRGGLRIRNRPALRRRSGWSHPSGRQDGSSWNASTRGAAPESGSRRSTTSCWRRVDQPRLPRRRSP